MIFLHINDPEVEQMIERAAGAACSALDESFPGKDGHRPGITSNFQGLLADVLRQMLTGNDPLAQSRGHFVALPRLALADRHFGNIHATGDGYVVALRDAPLQVLNDSGSRFVPLSSDDEVDPYTSFEAAVQGAMGYLKRCAATTDGFPIIVLPVFMADTGYSLAPASQQVAA